MKKIAILVLIGLLSIPVFASNDITIITRGVNARLCPYPSCGSYQHITRIPQGTVLETGEVEYIKTGIMLTKWFKVVYQNNIGWVSIYDTDRQ